MFRRMRLNLLSTLGHIGDQQGGDAPDLEQATPGIKIDVIPNLPQSVRQFISIDLTACHLLGIDRAGFETGHGNPMAAVGHNQDRDMGVKMLVKFSWHAR